MKRSLVLALVIVIVGTLSFAQEQEQKETKFGIGFQAAFPAYGISGMIDVADNISVQGILGMLGDLKTYAGRGIYRFRKEPYWDTYGYGMIGAWSYTGYEFEIGDDLWDWNLEETTETVIGFGAGVGVEYNWQGWSPNLPPVWWNLEVGLGSVKFEKIDYDFSTFMIGCGVHYRF